MQQLDFRKITDADLPLLESWLRKEHVVRWFTDTEDWLDELHNRDGKFGFLHHYIVYEADAAIGFCQYYDCFDAQEEWYEITVPGHTYSIDYLIGEEEYLGKGYGKQIIRMLVELIRRIPTSRRIVVQPDDGNDSSRGVLEANGFLHDGQKGYYFLDFEEVK